MNELVQCQESILEMCFVDFGSIVYFELVPDGHLYSTQLESAREILSVCYPALANRKRVIF